MLLYKKIPFCVKTFCGLWAKVFLINVQKKKKSRMEPERKHFKNHHSLQDKSIEEQLSKGIRFFDLRIAHKPEDSSSDLYFTHVIYTYLTVIVRWSALF